MLDIMEHVSVVVLRGYSCIRVQARGDAINALRSCSRLGAQRIRQSGPIQQVDSARRRLITLA